MTTGKNIALTRWTFVGKVMSLLFNMLSRLDRMWSDSMWSYRMWSTVEGNGKPLQYSCLENSMNSMKRQKDKILKMNFPGQYVPNMLLEISGEIIPEGMKGQNQRKNNTQLWM